MRDKVIFRIVGDRVEVEPLPMTLDEAYGSVTPLNQPEDFAELRRLSREERVAEATFLCLAKTSAKSAIESGVQLGWGATRWRRAAGQYADKIERDYGRLPIFGKDRYVPIDEIYTYVHVLDQQDAFHQFAEDQLAQLYVRRNLSYDPGTRQDGWRMVAEGDDLFILRDPDAGKTTFLKMAAIKAARGELRRQDDCGTD